MLNLWRAEWLQIYRRPANQMMLATIGIIYALLFVTILFIFHGGEYPQAERFLSFPHNIKCVIFAVTKISTFWAISFIAHNLGSEYALDTWKMSLPRCQNRVHLMLMKASATFAWLFVLIVFSLIIWLAFSVIAAPILGIPFKSNTNAPIDNLLTWSNIGVSILNTLLYSAITFLSVVISRSVAGGMIGGLFVTGIMSSAGGLASYAWLSRCIPTAHIDNIEAHWTANKENLAISAQILGGDIPTYISLLVVFGSIALIFGTSCYLFKSRELAN